MSTLCEEKKAEQMPDPIKELLCKAHAIGFSEEELAELRNLYGRGQEAAK
ncbi:hypothetical protein ATL17_2096 [Maritalea mobilis]|uniref:Uncharacterized protein n=1 Tax=Maritalea mobilis TaxID=483324 RepID=A0A4R6VKS9_9HYPH|nr:hypothetical protein [Maritalea mobilis]TDQ64085.1 hypothetical protein ATL17_2096 [Maritalea mobilis]